MHKDNPSSLINLGIVLAFCLLVAAVWVSGVSAATGLAATAGLIILAVAGFAMANSGSLRPRDASDHQRDRMMDTTP